MLLLGTFSVVDEPDQDDATAEATKKIETFNNVAILVLLAIASAIELPRLL
jgi:hypothetical protein